MNRLHAMRVLIRVAELASFAQAAEQLGISASSVTRSISMLETDLNVLLLNRSTRKVSLTDVGREYLDSARTVIAQLDELESRLSRANREVRGTLRIVASSTFAGCGLFSLLAAYQKAHPDVCFDVTTCDGVIDLIPGGYDVGFSTECEIADSALVYRQLTTLREIVVASPSYLTRHGLPATPGQLNTHQLLSASCGASSCTWKFSGSGTSFSIEVNSGLRVSNSSAICAAAIAGMGIALLPALLVSEDLRGGRLLPVLSQFEVSGERQRVSVIYAGRNYVAAEVRTFVEFTIGQYRGAESVSTLRAIA
jgi:DNA-binding transcriptional LysR family regulator